jgi:hypothetical protein
LDVLQLLYHICILNHHTLIISFIFPHNILLFIDRDKDFIIQCYEYSKKSNGGVGDKRTDDEKVFECIIFITRDNSSGARVIN